MKKNILRKVLSGVWALLVVEFASAQTTYTSNGNGGGLFSNPATWGRNMTQSEMQAAIQAGTNLFVVADGDIVTIDDSINVKNLTVNGTLVFGEAAEKDHPVIVDGAFTVGAGGKALVSDYIGIHSLRVKGGFTSSGVINFRKGTGKAVNVVFTGTQTVTVDSDEEKTKFNNFEVAKGKVTAGSDLRIGGAFTIGAEATLFNAGNNTIYIAGNFAMNKSEAFTRGNSTVVFNGSTVQLVSNVGKLYFNNVIVNGTGFVVVSNDMNVYGDFLVKNHSTLSTSAILKFSKEFKIEAGGKFDSNASYTQFVGENDQDIIISGDVTFAGIYCSSTAVTTKLIKGSINSTQYIRAMLNAKIADDANTYHHVFSGATAHGGIDLSSPMTIKGGTLRYSEEAENAEFRLGGGDITIETGEVYVKAGDTFRHDGDITVASGAFVLSGNDDGTQAELIGNHTNTLAIASGARFYVRGANDNFPKDIIVDINESSTTYYDSKFDQKVHGATYGHLALDYYDKEFTGPSYIAGHMYMRPMTNGESTVDFGEFSHTLCYHFYDEPDRKGTTSIKSSGTITLKSTGSHGQTIYKRTDGEYKFNKLVIASDDPTYAQTKTIGGEIYVNSLTITNSSENEILRLSLDIDDNVIHGGGGGLVMGSNTCIKVSGADNFTELITSIGNVDLDENSIVQFDATKVDQEIPGITYGNIYIYGGTAKIIDNDITVKGWIDQNGGSPKLTITDPDVTVTIKGDWKLAAGNLNLVSNSTIVFGGENQEIVATTLPNVQISGSGIKTLKGTLTVEGNLSVNSSSAEFNADNRTINLYGNFSNYEGGGGRFHQTGGRLNLRGDNYDQTVECGSIANTKFFNVYIEKKKDDKVTFLSDVYVSGNMMTAENRGSLEIEDHTLTIGGDLYLYRNCSLIYTDGAKLHFNSSDAEQLIRNYNTENTYPTMKFSGSAVKRPYDNVFDINGDVEIDNGAIVAPNVKLKVSGNWKNYGTFNSSSEVEFDRTAADGDDGNQLISGSTFNNVTFGGTGRKRLGGIINVTGWLKIDSLAILDVSPDDISYYDITIAGHWYNDVVAPDGVKTGYFEPHKGTVTFVGNSTYIYSGDTLTNTGEGIRGKSFYNVVINTSDPTNYKGLYPIHDPANAKKKTMPNDLYVINNFTINSGIFYFYWNKVFVGGNLRNLGGNLSMNGHHEAINKLYLGGAAGKNLEFDPGMNNTIRQIEINNGATYKLTNSYLQYTSTPTELRDSIINIKKGTLWMKNCDITFYESGGIRIGKEGTLHMDSAAVIEMYSGRKLENFGNLELKGDPSSPAKIKSASSGWYYYIVQQEGTFSAEEFSIEGTRGRGLEIRGGTISKLQNGEFSNSGYTWNDTDRTFYGVAGSETTALLTLDGITLGGGSGITAKNITFNVRETYPQKNVRRTSGSGAITFTNYDGTLAGSDYELDATEEPELIIWSEPSGIVWTGKGDGSSWHDEDNWYPVRVPDSGDDVILNHKEVTGTYTVNVKKRANVKNLTIDKNITLNLVGEDANANGLVVDGKLSMMTGSNLTQTNSCDSLILHGSWTCSGTYTHNHNPVVFDMNTGTYHLILNASANIGYMIVRSSKDGALSMSGTINVTDSVRIESGTLYGGTATVKLQGNWIPAGGVFEEGESIVDFCSTDKEQFVRGGRFWEIKFEGAGKKTIDQDISVNRMFRILEGVSLISAKSNNIYMSGRTTYWYNYVGDNVFEHLDRGAVIFTGGSASIGYIDGNNVKQTKPTKFNNLVIQGTSTKYIRDITIVDGAFEMVSGVDVTINSQGSLIGGPGSTFTQYGGALLVYGEDNFPQDFGMVDLVGGSVYYRDSCKVQTVRSVEYNNLYLYNYYFVTNGEIDKKSVTKKLEGDIAVKGTMYIYDSITTLDVQNKKITLTGNLSMADDGKPIKWGTDGTVIHIGGTWSVDADIDTLNHVYKKGTGYLTMNNDLIVKGDIEFDPETQLRMGSYKMTGRLDKNFKMGVNCQLHTSVVKDGVGSVAFPTNFGSYELDPTSTTYLEAAADQILYCDVVYGNLYLNNTASRTVVLDGDLRVRGNFYNNQDGTVLNDNGHNLYLSGATNDLRNYHPATTTVYLNGDIDQKVLAGGGFTELYLNNLELSGESVKEIDETLIKIVGNVTIGAKASFSSNDAIEFSGDNITNNGTFRHYGSTFTFTGDNTHTISMGGDNIFNGFSLADDVTVNIIDTGIVVNTGVFSLGKRAELDMGNFTHKIASTQIDLGTDCNWITESANLIFNRGGGQTIPALTCRNIRFSNSSTKTLAGKLTADTLIIDEGVTFSVGSDAKKSNSVTIFGDWICDGSFTSHNDTVYFESKEACKTRKIKTNEQWFSDVVFHHTTKMGAADTSKFLLQDKMQLKNNMVIDTGAVLCLNHNTLVIGNDDSNITDPPYFPDGEGVKVEKGGELYIDAGASLQFDHLDGYPYLEVDGRLTMIGSSSANAVITRSSSKHDTHGTKITINKGAKLAARYYQVQYLAPTGFVIKNGAIIDDKNNLSDGIWSNMYTTYGYKNPFQADDNVKIDSLVYLTINVDKMTNPIINIAFNHGGTPTEGHHFNIARNISLPNHIKIDGIINGALGWPEYKLHPDLSDGESSVHSCNIEWPAIEQIEWTGAVSQDWFDRRNWRPMQVPDKDHSVRIPMKSNAPIIYKQGASGAQCKNLTIAKGSLTIENIDKTIDVPSLLVNGSVDVQDGGVLAVEDVADIKVFGDWSIAKKGYFVPQNGTVIFAADGGSVSIVPRLSDFNNVIFEGQATYMFTGTTINFNGDFIVNKGLVWPSTADYIYNIGGNYKIANSGGFNTDVVGYVKFIGADQTIENGKFNRVTFSNAGTKLLSGTFDAVYNSSTRTYRTIIIEDNATLKASAGCSLTIKGNVLINSGAKFDDGNQEHTFTGYYWESTGSYAGTGKINFNANHAQYIWGGKFHDVDMTLNTKNINGDVTMTGNLNMESCTLDMLVNHITGAGTFTMGDKSNVYARGENNYPKFNNYEVTGGSTCYSYYNGPMDQTIRAAKYGNLYLNSNTTKTLEGDITVLKNLYFYDNGGTLRANGKNIFVGQHWYNQYSGKFEPENGSVIFNGSEGNQCAYLGVSVENPFYDIQIDKPESQQFYASSVDLDVQGSLYVTSGKMHCVSGYRVRVGGNVTVGASGLITESGHYELYRLSGECSIQTGASILNDLTIYGDDCKFKLNDDLTVYGNFTLRNGIEGSFDQNKHVATLGNSLDNVAIYGTYIVGPGGKLRMGDGTSLVVKDGGIFDAVGEPSSYALITNNGGTGRYYFTVEQGGTIKAEYYNFSYLAKQGVIVSNGAYIDEDCNFSNGVFSNVVSGGVCLDIRTDEYMDEGGRIENISFPNNPGGGAVNIRKVESSTGDIEVHNATGLLAGELYENDPYGIIHWTGDVEYTWTGAKSEDWWDKGNWIAKQNGVSYPATVPTADNNVTIPTSIVSGKYPIIDRGEAKAKRLTIEKNARLTIKITTDRLDTVRCALSATSDVTVDGTLTMNSSIDSLDVGGNWVIGTAGTLAAGEGTVRMSGVGVKTIQNRGQSFNNLVIENNGTMQAQSAMKVGGNFTLTQGVFDVTSYDVSVGGSFINNATFLPQTKTLILTGAAPASAEGHKFCPGNNGYYNVTVSGGTYSLEGNEFSVSRNLDITGGTLDVEANTINIGDGTGVDNLNITGILSMHEDSKLKMGNNAIINVNVGGTIMMEGRVNHEAIVTTQKLNGTYAFNVYGTIAAYDYKIERINADGVHLFAGSTIDRDKNLSHGQFMSGVTGGRYLWFENNFGTDNNDTISISNIYFNIGPDVNAKRDDNATDGVIVFCDAVGVVASYYFEDDDNNPARGAIVWKYTSDVLEWVGNAISGADVDGTRWDNPLNWKSLSGREGGYPNANTLLHIYPVGHGKYPVIYSDNRDEYALAKGITLWSGASLTLDEDRKLKVEGADAGLIIGKDAIFTAKDSVFIKGQFSNAGQFDNGGRSTIVWASSLSCNIEMNGWPFYNFIVKNDGDATVTLSVEPGKALIIEHDFTIESGTVNCNGGTLTVGGDFKNKSGTFLHGNGTVIMNGASLQNLSSENGDMSFFNLELIGAGQKDINIDIDVAKNITVGAPVKAADDVDIICHGDWKRPLSTSFENNFIGGSGWVRFKGSSLQNISKPETFTNLEIDNSSSATAIQTNYSLTISKRLELTHGIISATNPVRLTDEASVSNGGMSSYINGAIEKTNAVDTFFFPIGGNDRYAPIAITGFDEPGTYQVVYHSEAPGNQANLEDGLNKVSRKEFWNLTRNAGTKMPWVALYWFDDKFSEIVDYEVMSVVLYTGGKWTRQGVMNMASDLCPITPGDTTKGHLISHEPLSVSGDVTFGFSYPTITWKKMATTDAFADKHNWSSDKREPSATVNILVNEFETNHPVVSSESHCYDMTIRELGELEIAEGQTLTVHGIATIEGKLKLGKNSKIYFLKDVYAATANVDATAEGSVVYISADVAQRIELSKCHNLVIMGGRNGKRVTKTLASDITIEGSITINEYTALNAGSNTINLKGDFNIISDGGFDGRSTLIMCGEGKQLLAITPHKKLYNLTIRNTYEGEDVSGVDLGTGICVSGHLELTKGILYSKSNARLCLESGATSSLGSKDSYVIGEMEKKGKEKFVFPIGSTERLAQIGISGLTFDQSVVAEYSPKKPVSVLALGDGVEKISHKEAWYLYSTGRTDAYVSLYWSDSLYTETNELATLFVCAYTNGKWTSFGQNPSESKCHGDSSGHVTSSGLIEINGATSIPRSMNQSTRRTLNTTPHTLASSGGVTVTFGTSNPPMNPLPIEVVTFDAVVAGNNTDVKLTWSTASEHNNASFTIEHMFNGESEIVGTIVAQGKAGEGADYSYLHINLSSGTHYYRLLQTDFDGNTTVAADWIAVVIENAERLELAASVAPNPGKCQNIKISVSGITGSKLRYVVADMSGQTLIDRTIGTDGMSAFQIDASDWNLQPSVYLIKVFTDNGQTVSKFVVE